jgi:hypothetical protein
VVSGKKGKRRITQKDAKTAKVTRFSNNLAPCALSLIPLFFLFSFSYVSLEIPVLVINPVFVDPLLQVPIPVINLAVLDPFLQPPVPVVNPAVLDVPLDSLVTVINGPVLDSFLGLPILIVNRHIFRQGQPQDNCYPNETGQDHDQKSLDCMHMTPPL